MVENLERHMRGILDVDRPYARETLRHVVQELFRRALFERLLEALRVFPAKLIPFIALENNPPGSDTVKRDSVADKILIEREGFHVKIGRNMYPAGGITPGEISEPQAIA